MMPRKLLLVGSLCILISSSACRREPLINTQNLELNEYIVAVMQDWYLWNDQLPTVSPGDYDDPSELVRALRFKELDKWSRISKTETEDAYYNEGQAIGYGFSIIWDNEDSLRMGHVIANSAAGRAGLTRGTNILEINGLKVQDITNLSDALGPRELGVTSVFKIRDLTGEVKEINLARDFFTIDPVPYHTMYTINEKKVGYFVFSNFINPAKNRLATVFNEFQLAGVEDLVVDLRYNGGGLVDVAEQLASLIAPEEATGEIFAKYSHNADRAENSNRSINFGIPQFDMGLNRVFILATRNSASASELLINSLHPFMEVIVIGDNTHGKPVGSYIFEHMGYSLSAINFQVVNADDEGDYFDGIVPDAYKYDGLQFDWGDPREYMLSEALHYINNGTFTGRLTGRSTSSRLQPQSQLDGLEQEIGLF